MQQDCHDDWVLCVISFSGFFTMLMYIYLVYTGDVAEHIVRRYIYLLYIFTRWFGDE